MKTDAGYDDWCERTVLDRPSDARIAWNAATKRALRAIDATERESDLADSATCTAIRRRIARDESTW